MEIIPGMNGGIYLKRRGTQIPEAVRLLPCPLLKCRLVNGMRLLRNQPAAGKLSPEAMAFFQRQVLARQRHHTPHRENVHAHTRIHQEVAWL